MRTPRPVMPLALLLALASAPAAAQQPAAGLVGDLITDIEEVEGKLLGLARAIPADKWGWRPAEGVRSVHEVFKHVVADNYLIPAMAGAAAPAETGIRGDAYQTALDYENRPLTRDETIAQLESSFAHLKAALRATSESAMNETVALGRNQASKRYLWVLAATHVHEHLGQMIAYARSNGVVPPWSRG